MSKLRIVLLALVLLLLSLSPVHAQETPLTGELEKTSGLSDNPNGYKITQEEVNAYNEAVKDCSAPSLECLVRYTTRFVAIEWVNDINGNPDSLADAGGGGAVASLFGMMGNMYEHRPAQTSAYIADVLNSAGIAQPAYAQGLGFASLDPVLNLWKIFRNVAYFFFIVIFMIIGFMIMLRQKISGQAVVTAQQAIPSVIISLILVTFSYAIAGFMIDMMYVLMFLILGLFQSIGGEGFPAGDKLITMNILELITTFYNSGAIGGFGENITILKGVFDSAGATGPLGDGLGILGGLTLTIIISVAVLVGTIRLFFELLKSYAAIVLYVVSAPLTLMFGALPGKSVFWPWFKALVGNLLAFPVVLLVLILFIQFTANSGSAVEAGAGFMPPFLFGNTPLEGAATGAVSMIGPLLGLALILALPDIVKDLKKTMGASELGFGGKIMGWAGENMKDWGRAGYKDVPGGKMLARATALPVTLPMAGIGGYMGYKYGDSKARELGLEGKQAAFARFGGLAAGLGAGFNAPKLAVKGGKELAMQYAQSQGLRFINEAEEAARSRAKAANQLSGQQALGKEGADQKASAEALKTATNPEQLTPQNKQGVNEQDNAATRGL